MDKTSRKPTTRTRCPTDVDKWHRIFYVVCPVVSLQLRLDMPSPLVNQSWSTMGGVKVVSFDQVWGGREATTCPRSTSLINALYLNYILYILHTTTTTTTLRDIWDWENNGSALFWRSAVATRGKTPYRLEADMGVVSLSLYILRGI